MLGLNSKHQAPSSRETPGSKFQVVRGGDLRVRPRGRAQSGAWGLKLSWRLVLGIWSLLTAWPSSIAPAATPPELAPGPVEFNQQIRPILAHNCYLCHGPDKGTRKAGLRLDDRDA